MVCAIGVEDIWLIQRQYRPGAFVMQASGDYPTFSSAKPGDAELFYANANRFVAPHPRWVSAGPPRRSVGH